MFASPTPIVLTDAERQELASRSRARTLRARDVRRARLILMLADGSKYTTIQERLGCTAVFISTWKARFLEGRLEGLYGRHQGSRQSASSQRLEARILNTTRKPPPDGSTHWTTRKLAAHLGISHMRVARVWARAGLKPHRFERYMASNDPDFEAKALDVSGLYLNPIAGPKSSSDGRTLLPRKVDRRGEDASRDHVALDLLEPELDLVEPGGVRRREVQMELEELLHASRLVRREVVEDHVDLAVSGVHGHQGTQEGDELLAGVARCGPSENHPRWRC